MGGAEAVRSGWLTVVRLNRPPEKVGTLEDRSLRVGGSGTSLVVSGAFFDPDGDSLSYRAHSSAPSHVAVAVSGDRVTLTPQAPGAATVTVVATDVGGSNRVAIQRFEVTVEARVVTVAPEVLAVVEGTAATYKVSLGAEPTGPVTVTVSLPGGTDLAVQPQYLVFATSDWYVARTVTVEALDDGDSAADAMVTISHRVSGGGYDSVGASSVRVFIAEDDAPTLSVLDAQAGEGDAFLVFEVTLSVAASSDVTVDYVAADGSGPDAATSDSDSDYSAVTGTLTFPSGSTSPRLVYVPVTDDAVDEAEEETFNFTLRNPTNALLVLGGRELTVAGTILDDDDPQVVVSFGSDSYDVAEGSSVDVALRLSADPERLVEIPLVSQHHGGVTLEDYSGLPERVSFVAGQTQHVFTFAATFDDQDDDGEAVSLRFGALPDGVTGDGEVTLALHDDDGSGSGGDTGGGPGGPGGPPPSDDEDEDEDDGGGGGGSGSPPRAAITVDAVCAGDLCRAQTGVPIRFEDSSTGSVRFRTWEFGDGATSRSRTADHAWSEPGFYDVTLWVSDGGSESTVSRTFLVEASDPAGTCEADGETLCLRDSRYSVEVEWRTADGQSGAGRVSYAGTNDSGLFYFFNPDNWEVLIKVLDACALNGQVWVFGASTTDLGYRIAVTDTVTGVVREYGNEPGRPATAITDVMAFPGDCGGARAEEARAAAED